MFEPYLCQVCLWYPYTRRLRVRVPPSPRKPCCAYLERIRIYRFLWLIRSSCGICAIDTPSPSMWHYTPSVSLGYLVIVGGVVSFGGCPSKSFCVADLARAEGVRESSKAWSERGASLVAAAENQVKLPVSCKPERESNHSLKQSNRQLGQCSIGNQYCSID
ncbi:hypothetical protein IW262DRAFT_577397 [Armillaria fumosa]|nr:hypothetical protein IW262DRAFT_577397 [Armillaria fumosa]